MRKLLFYSSKNNQHLNLIEMTLIETTTDLEALCQRLNAEKFVCVDLEFLREHTYFAKLCLIQIAAPDIAAVIDPLAKDLSLEPFFELMQNNKVVKVFHSSRQDIEIIYTLSQKIPTPLYDTQIAAQADGFGESVSYEHLVSALLNIELDKSSRLSDWSRRPLSEKQLSYALSDVTHLVNIYLTLKENLDQNGRTHWIDEELEKLSDVSLYKTDPQEAWKRIRHRSHSAQFLTLLRELAAWRENRSILKNLPRQSFVKDDVLLNICAAQPETKEDLAGVRGIQKDFARGKLGDEIIGVLQNAKRLSKENYVTPPPVKDFSGTETALAELLRILLKSVAQEQKISTHLLCSEEDIKSYCAKHNDPVAFMTGWRYEIFGRLAEKLRDGNTALAYNPELHTLKFIDISKQN